MWWLLFIFLASCVGLAGLAVFVKIYAKCTCGRYKINKGLPGLEVVITGASSGIGKCVALELAKHGAVVHMVCRNMAKANPIADYIKDVSGNPSVYVWQCDLSKLQSVRNFAKKFLESDREIHLLINNAGIALAGLFHRTLTEDGLELTMATNHFGHFLLTNLLLDRIKESKCQLLIRSRIVVLSSIVHLFYKLDLDDLNIEHSYNGFKSYCLSKLANILFTKHLSKMLRDSEVTVNCLHPGAVRTDLTRAIPSVLQPLLNILLYFFKVIHLGKDKTPEEGAESVLYVALSDALNNVTGHYFWDNNLATVFNQGSDMHLAEQLWNASAQLTKLKDVS